MSKFEKEFINEYIDFAEKKEKIYKKFMEEETDPGQKERFKMLLEFVKDDREFIDYMLESLENKEKTVM